MNIAASSEIHPNLLNLHNSTSPPGVVNTDESDFKIQYLANTTININDLSQEVEIQSIAKLRQIDPDSFITPLHTPLIISPPSAENSMTRISLNLSLLKAGYNIDIPSNTATPLATNESSYQLAFAHTPHSSIQKNTKGKTDRILQEKTIEWGNFKNNQLHGKGYRKCKDEMNEQDIVIRGAEEQGEFDQGFLIFGERIILKIYEEGHFAIDPKDGLNKLDGAGQRTYEDGTKEIGMFENGQFIKGSKEWGNGIYDRGFFDNGLLTGNRCKRLFPNGKVLLGGFLLGAFRGHGVKKFKKIFQAGIFDNKPEFQKITKFANYDQAKKYFEQLKEINRKKEIKNQFKMKSSSHSENLPSSDDSAEVDVGILPPIRMNPYFFSNNNALFVIKEIHKYKPSHNNSPKSEKSNKGPPKIILPQVRGPQPSLNPDKKPSSLLI